MASNPRPPFSLPVQHWLRGSSNYVQWATAMQDLFIVHDCWSYISGESENASRFTKDNAYFLIWANLPPSVIGQVAEILDGVGLWNRLKELYSPRVDARAQEVRMSLETLALGDFSSVPRYANAMQELVTQLAQSSIAPTSYHVAHCFLTGMLGAPSNFWTGFVVKVRPILRARYLNPPTIAELVYFAGGYESVRLANANRSRTATNGASGGGRDSEGGL